MFDEALRSAGTLVNSQQKRVVWGQGDADNVTPCLKWQGEGGVSGIVLACESLGAWAGMDWGRFDMWMDKWRGYGYWAVSLAKVKAGDSIGDRTQNAIAIGREDEIAPPIHTATEVREL